ncbi:hypothetical protein MT340_007700 [Staphylococcus sp. NRL 16/872]|uniref:hypothetical protein n=1 Tax=Staphylococcus sp. NRL 16/872 TaxID=2930131 RepID=UPI001FB4AA16|nr:MULTISPECIES: hypothetical protein [unclassified Staphylococcus]MCJ1656453.1 hypothetical protein [Staphylococcus sp. NRL 21/187]MCJ1662219.1 hypothetical protein [Staphylococcus sp. NRL 18/288]MCJ1668291.1 hypothetical protein [Staphylococcus sp. NRL 19/737]WEN68489.1 hypothetical protein MT340_007700 [Staphylococcus sp. NRL 16/872]
MNKVKFKKLKENTLEELENKVNEFLASEEGRQYQLLNVSVEKVEEQKFPHNEEVLSAILTLVNQ